MADRMATDQCDSYLELPSDLWLYIMSYLDYRDIATCSQINRQLNELSEHHSLWRPLCKRHWLQTNCPASKSWKDHFVDWYLDFGRYIGCYATIKTAWSHISEFMKQNCKHIYDSINPGISDFELDDIERKIGYNLPTDLRCSYRIHNGQQLVSPGLLGGIYVNNHYKSEALLDVFLASEGLQEKSGFYGTIPLTFCVHTGYSQRIALSDRDGHVPNQIFAFNDDSEGDARSRNAERHIFIFGKDFTSWIKSYAKSLIDSRFTVIHNQVFRFYRNPDCVARTESIRVFAATCFIPEFSTAGHIYFHSYQITLQMDEDAPKSSSCQLETRHWIVTDENGDEERVDGPGVVGEYPIMRPGATFTWISCTSFKTTHGNMRGHFTMRNLRTGDHLEVECPVFHMKCPPYMTLNIQPDDDKRKKE